MKMGILVLTVVGLLGLSGWLFYDNSELRKKITRQELKAEEELSSAEGKVRDQAATIQTELATAQAEIARLNNQIAFPVRITSKRLPGANTYGVQVFNQSPEIIPVVVTFSNAKTGRTKNMSFDLGPGFSREVGRMDGWSATVGDSVQVECPGFMPVSRLLN